MTSTTSVKESDMPGPITPAKPKSQTAATATTSDNVKISAKSHPCQSCSHWLRFWQKRVRRSKKWSGRLHRQSLPATKSQSPKRWCGCPQPRWSVNRACWKKEVARSRATFHDFKEKRKEMCWKWKTTLLGQKCSAKMLEWVGNQNSREVDDFKARWRAESEATAQQTDNLGKYDWNSRVTQAEPREFLQAYVRDRAFKCCAVTCLALRKNW